ncbi:hypothetical protein AAGS40_28400 (plasmid) [Paraburkholderia sp. PREW-6R]|uniref:hypothetical protein n=1 Tax=Paraburkholderia sp. PREW-6R TaxID=3141544 RepID=UPI0031F53D21
MIDAITQSALGWAQYSATEGVAELREALTTASTQQGFDLLTRLLLDAGTWSPSSDRPTR